MGAALWLLGAGPAAAATLDLEDLSSPSLPRQPSAPPLPLPSPALGKDGQQPFRDGLRRFLSGDFAGAERRARGLTATAPNAPEGWYLLGMALANLERRPEAVSALDRAAGLYSANAAPLIIKGDLLLSLGDAEAAGAAWAAAVARDPASLTAQLRHAAYLEATGDPAGALRAYETALAIRPDTLLQDRAEQAPAGAHQSPSRSAPESRPEDSAARRLTDPAPAVPGSAVPGSGSAGPQRETPAREAPEQEIARLQAARLYLRAGAPAQAEALLEPGAKAETAPALLLDYLGRAKVALDKPAEAAALFDRLIARGESSRPFLARAGIALAAQDVSGAAEILAQARHRFPGDPVVLLEQGRVEGAAGRYGAALEAFETGLQAAPEDLGLRRAASLAASRLGARDLALSHARLAAAHPKASPEDPLRLAALVEPTSPQEAEALYRRVLAMAPQHWLALNNLASLLLQRAPHEALSLAQQAVALNPAEPRLRDTLGQAQLAAGALPEAAATFEALRAQTPKAALPAYRLGLVRLAQGRMPEARALLQEALALDPDFALAAEARRHLQ